MLKLLGGRLKEARLRARMSQTRLADEMGSRYDHSVISAIENGRCKVRIEGLVAAAAALDVSADYLLGLTDEPARRPLSAIDGDDEKARIIHVRSAEERGIIAALHDHYTALNPYGRRLFVNTLERTFPDTIWRRRERREIIFDFGAEDESQARKR